MQTINGKARIVRKTKKTKPIQDQDTSRNDGKLRPISLIS